MMPTRILQRACVALTRTTSTTSVFLLPLRHFASLRFMQQHQLLMPQPPASTWFLSWRTTLTTTTFTSINSTGKVACSFSSDSSNALEELDMSQVKGIRRNMSIRDKVVRLVDEKGMSIGVLPTVQAIEMAKEQGMDLVEVTPASSSSEAVCKLMTYKMFLDYKQSLVKKRTAEKVKEVMFTSEIMENDLQMKMRQLEKFLQEGYLVEVKLIVKGKHEKMKQGTDTMLFGTQLLTTVLKRLQTEVAMVGLMQSNDANASVRIRAVQVDHNTKQQQLGDSKQRKKFLMDLQLSEERVKELRAKQKREEQERQRREAEDEQQQQQQAASLSSTTSDFATSVNKKYGGITPPSNSTNNTKTTSAKHSRGLPSKTASPLANAKVNVREPPKKIDSTTNRSQDENDPDNTRDIQRIQKPSLKKKIV
eukprot:TRINITY_DN11462_c0_g1_i1.p1 TRINITY_DN11462_c0_g1~~TRINITY_DN11462_c0_g1_i1.p1  ORF type:complete len:442 (-),score=115.08 TRINITY_DN11462_c0_g1_i1:51-1313(-)